MPSFDTAEPVQAHIDVAAGDVRIAAGERTDAVVDVRPSDPAAAADREAAEETRVLFVRGHLVVTGARGRAWRGRRGGSVDVVVQMPAGSGLHGSAGAADFACDGALGDVRIRTGAGNVRLEGVGSLSVRSGSGDVAVDHATGSVEVTVTSGDIRLARVDGSAVVRSAGGDTWIGAVGGALRATAANGAIDVDVARDTAVAKAAQGGVRIGEAAGATVVLESAHGDLEIGIPEGTAAWLDVRSGAGRLHNGMEAATGPGDAPRRVEVRARTTLGDVTIRRP